MAHCPYINNKRDDADCQINDTKRVHRRGDCLSNAMLIKRHMVATTEPKINVGNEMNATPIGTKNAITTVPTRIFEISEKYFERVKI